MIEERRQGGKGTKKKIGIVVGIIMAAALVAAMAWQALIDLVMTLREVIK